MKGGQTPIHVMRWAASDFVNDPFVKLLVSRRDYRTFTLYILVLNYSHIEGGDLPADMEALAAMIGMNKNDVAKALPVCLEAKKLHIEETCLFNNRVRRDVQNELNFRSLQQSRGRAGGKASAGKRSVEHSLDQVLEHSVDHSLEKRSSHVQQGRSSPPAPAPAPAPAPLVGANPPAFPLPPDVEAERSIRAETWSNQRKLLAVVGALARRLGRDVPEVMREVTAYKRPDGSVVKGRTNPADLSPERVDKSLEDAEAWLGTLGAA